MLSKSLKYIVVLLCFGSFLSIFWEGRLEASGISFGVSGGMEAPLWQHDTQELGPRVDAFYRLDPYEVRFHYAYLRTHYYSVLLGRKHFFSQEMLRPFVEVALGPTIVNTPSEGLAYGVSPELSLGVDLGVSPNFSTNIITRYTAYWYFGQTKEGSMEANHSLSIVAGLTLWF